MQELGALTKNTVLGQQHRAGRHSKSEKGDGVGR